jgi:hypothetical protein
MKLERETKGALRYMEVDEDGDRVEIQDGAKIGTLYIRKSALHSGVYPDNIVVEIQIGQL